MCQCRPYSLRLCALAFGLISLGLLTGLAKASAAETIAEVSSPNDQNMIRVSFDPWTGVGFEVIHGGTPILSTSQLGLVLANDTSLFENLEVVSVSPPRDVSERYELVAGKHTQAASQGTERVVALRQETGNGLKLELHFRAYDDGVAFRYVIPSQSNLKEIRIQRELTSFAFPDDPKCWPGLFDGFANSNETEFNPTLLSKVDSSKLIGVPLTMRTTDGVVLCLTESNLASYSGAFLRRLSGESNILQFELAPHPDHQDACVVAEETLSSPWRTLIIGDDLSVLFDTDLITSLSEPSRIADTSWIKPGKAVFPWWPNFKSDNDKIPSVNCFENAKAYIDFASELGLEYLELEPPWYGPEEDSIHHPDKYDVTKPLPEMRLPELFAYAAEKNVSILLWVHWKSLHNRLEEAFTTFAKWGARGVKIDYLDRVDQAMVEEYAQILEQAAKHKLVVFFHGAYAPRGIQRTWPNGLTREGVMGNEYNKWSNRVTATHNVTLPYTRMVVGPMDYTPGGFRNVTPQNFKENFDLPVVMSTRCQQLAMFVVYESPLQMVCDYPGAYRNQPGTEFLSDVPATWTETRFLEGDIGSHIVMARRSGDTWYLAAMTNEANRELKVPLDFLGQGSFRGELWRDADEANIDPTQLTSTSDLYDAEDSVTLALTPNGGAVLKLSPIKE